MVSHHNHNTIAPMEGLRGFAAFMVFVVHFAAQSQVWIPENSFTYTLIFYLRFLGATGVDLFFVLSGFLIYGMLVRKDVAYITYAKRRIKRIYPTFLVVSLVYLILSFVFPAESKLPSGLFESIEFITMSLLLLPGVMDVEPLFTVAWTLSYEMFFYLITPFVMAIFALRRRSPKFRISFLLLLGVGFYLINLTYDLHIRMLMFISGMLVYEFSTRKELFKQVKPEWLLPLTFVLMLIARATFYDDYQWLVVPIMFFGYGICCLSLFEGKTALGRFFATPLMRWYGNMSYSYYLIHGLTLKFLFLCYGFLHTPLQQDAWVFYALMIPFFGVTLVVSAVLFVVIERPLSLGTMRH